MGLGDAMMVPQAGQLYPVMDTLLAQSTVNPFYFYYSVYQTYLPFLNPKLHIFQSDRIFIPSKKFNP